MLWHISNSEQVLWLEQVSAKSDSIVYRTLTAVKSGLSSITLLRSGSADLDFPKAKYTVALLKYVK